MRIRFNIYMFLQETRIFHQASDEYFQDAHFSIYIFEYAVVPVNEMNELLTE